LSSGSVVLEVKDLKKYFGNIRAVDNVSFKIHEKEIVAIVGDNGAGKSTIIKTISGIYKKDSGSIYIEGKEKEITNPRIARKYGIETVYQDQKLVTSFDASENLFMAREKLVKNIFGKFFGFLDFGYMQNETDKLLKKIGITVKDINNSVENLSGGQRQAIVVGRAVYWGGKILIFDEPTNNLGVIQEKKVIELIKKIRDEYSVSIIVISHNIAHVFDLVDRIIVLRNGKIVGERIKDKTNPNEIVSMITGLVA
jgi:ABC-type sugar transport system ATPase subunit